MAAEASPQQEAEARERQLLQKASYGAWIVAGAAAASYNHNRNELPTSESVQHFFRLLEQHWASNLDYLCSPSMGPKLLIAQRRWLLLIESHLQRIADQFEAFAPGFRFRTRIDKRVERIDTTNRRNDAGVISKRNDNHFVVTISAGLVCALWLAAFEYVRSAKPWVEAFFARNTFSPSGKMSEEQTRITATQTELVAAMRRLPMGHLLSDDRDHVLLIHTLMMCALELAQFHEIAHMECGHHEMDPDGAHRMELELIADFVGAGALCDRLRLISATRMDAGPATIFGASVWFSNATDMFDVYLRGARLLYLALPEAQEKYPVSVIRRTTVMVAAGPRAPSGFDVNGFRLDDDKVCRDLILRTHMPISADAEARARAQSERARDLFANDPQGLLRTSEGNIRTFLERYKFPQSVKETPEWRYVEGQLQGDDNG